ncbi:MAG TPA: DUF2071 domain-containing protein [Euzebyales bacterium]|nr:DUF2071 domain-containing protein [Euzebyales bacterium]
MSIEPITPTAPHDVDRTVFTQTWARLTFLHWAVKPGRVAAHLPAGIRPDVIDDVTYVGLIPFWMQDVGVLGGPAVPFFGSFCETNVRLYSVDGAGRRGVVFVSLDASRLAPVLVARATGLPYVWSRMRYRRRGDLVSYTSRRRRWPTAPKPPGTDRARATGARSSIGLRVGRRIEPERLEHFLTARWGLHASDGRGGAVFWPNQHPPWSLHTATVEHLDDDLLAAAGFGDLARRRPDSVLFSPGVDVRFGSRRPA